MTNSIIGMERVEADFSNDNGSIEINTFQSNEKVVFYVSSRSLEKQTVDLDFSQMIGAYDSVSGIQLGYDPASSNGQHWNGDTNIASEFVTIDGTRYYWNEHDVRAKITQLNETQLGGGTDLTVTFKPYEVIEITYELSQVNIVNGTNGNDVALVGTNGVDKIFGFAGADTLDGRDGDDELQGGLGNDKLYGRAGADTLFGGDGQDVLYGGNDNDQIFGETGNDKLIGGRGRDTVTGGAGADTFIFLQSEMVADERITDFEPGTDLIKLDVDGVNSRSDLKIYLVGGDVDGYKISFSKVGQSFSILLEDTSQYSWSEIANSDNFIFV
ncbi:calcium-binding protein [Roseovarius mucosus]|nr:calcium-binding protein [Roseovarius mucosus]